MKNIPVSRLHDLFAYNPATGVLTWRERDRNLSGVDAGGLCRRGYRRVQIGPRKYFAHRIIMAMVNGEWPTVCIDHINGKCDDNRLCNLRLVSHQENMQNQALYRRNTSGHTGVYWSKECKKWRAGIRSEGKLVWLGLFPNIEDAVAARKAAEIANGFHPNHGRAA